MKLTQEKFINQKEETKLFKTMEPFTAPAANNPQAVVELFLYQLLSLSGLRISEALALTWDHIGVDYLMVEAGDAKSGHARSVVIGKRLLALLDKFLVANPYPESKFLFNTQKGQYKRTNAHDRLKYWLTVAGLRDSISCHSFRHSYATKGLDAGLGLPFMKEQLGHSNISITSVYLHFTRETKDKAYEVF